MECLETLVGLRGGCAAISYVGSVWLDDKVTHKELSYFIDQKDHASVDDMFVRWRQQAARELIDTVNEAFSGRYLVRTVVGAKEVGTTGDRLVAIPAEAKLKGLRFYRCNDWPSISYRITRLGFIGQFTGNLTVNYWDGITGNVLATDTFAVVAGQKVQLDVNRVFTGTRVLMVGYDATAIGSYSTSVCPSICYTCSNARKINAHVDGYGFNSTIGNVVGAMTSTNESSGLSVVVAMECDNEWWLCSIKQQLAMPMLYKVAQLAMEYALFNTDRNNTKTVRDADHNEKRASLYQREFTASMKRAVASIILPNDPLCFKCNRTSRVVVAIP